MDVGGASDRAKRIIGSQICRALLASAIEIKKKAACEIEGKVKLCLQRDERTAQNAIDIIIQTLVQEFLGVDVGEAGSLIRSSKTSSSHVIGGMLGLVGVVRGYPALCDRILATLSYIHEDSNDVTCLYYSSECIFNIILCAEQNNLELDFKLLFRVLLKLWLVRGLQENNETPATTSDQSNKSGAPSVLSHAIIWIDRSVREIAERQSIDVRELILNNQSIWKHLHTGWLDILLKNNRENGIMNLRKMLDLYYVLANQVDQKTIEHCKLLGELLAQEIEQSTQVADSACTELIAFWTASPVDEIKVEVVKNICEGLGAHTCAFKSMAHFTCFILSLEEGKTTNDDQDSSKFPITHWLDMLGRDVMIELSDQAWCLITHLISEMELVNYDFMISLAKHLLSGKYSEKLVENIKNSKWQEDTLRFWRPFGSLLTCENLARCVTLISRVEAPRRMFQAIEQIAGAKHSAEDLQEDVLIFYMTYLLGLNDPKCLSGLAITANSAPKQFVSLLSTDLVKELPPFSYRRVKIDGITTREFLEWLEVVLFSLEWPEALPYRLKQRQSNLYTVASYALPQSSPLFEVATTRARLGAKDPTVRITVEIRGSSEVVLEPNGRNPKIEILKRLRNFNKPVALSSPAADRRVEIPSAVHIDLVKKELASPNSEPQQQPQQTGETPPALAENKPMMNPAAEKIITTAADVTRSSPTSDADIDLDQSRSVPQTSTNTSDQRVNRLIAGDNEEPIY